MVSIGSKSAPSLLEGLQISEIWEASIELGFPSALWRLPHQHEVKLLISAQNGASLVQADLEKLAPGFIITTFQREENDPVLFMEGDIIVSYEHGQIRGVENRLGEEHPVFKKLVTLAKERKSKNNPQTRITLSGQDVTAENSRERYMRTVELAVAAITRNDFKKVVLSRTKEITLNEDFQPVEAFRKLASTYPHAFISLVNLPEQNEMWLGASPETLISQKANGIFKTMSLAGTQKAYNELGEILPKYDIRWGQKEIEEQALVSRYIVECFKKIRLREYVETGPKTVLAGNVYHLRTEFEVDTFAVGFPELATTMLKLLHPTSAICGEPKTASRDFLNTMEGYDRSFYSGFIGPVQINGDSDIFVNLRTARFKDGVATLYAGAGITEDSIPSQEWDETELKCETLLKVIV